MEVAFWLMQVMQVMRYYCIMRTTLSIDDRLLEEAREAAHRRGVTLGTIVEDALRRELNGARVVEDGPPIPVFRGGGGVLPGVDVASTRAILAVLDGDRPLDTLR